MQECLTHWFFVKEQFNPAREVTVKTFMKRVVKNKLLNILEERTAKKRQIDSKSISLDQLLEDSNGASERFIAVESGIMKTIKDMELHAALSKAFSRLSIRQKELCRLLGEEGLSVSDASKRLSIPRRTLRDEIQRIREVFRKEGLEDYLK
jgi:RNA polymerase sigma-70 factor (ECF subfamily)